MKEVKIGLRIYIYLFVICLISFNFLGCTTTSSSIKSDPTQIPTLEPAALLKFPDIPIPSTFKFIPEESYAFESSGFRAGLLKYHGKSAGDQVVSFFKEQMPMYNWHVVNIVEYGRRQLNFEKDQETCLVIVEVKGKKTDILISVAPKSQVAAPRKSDRPIK